MSEALFIIAILVVTAADIIMYRRQAARHRAALLDLVKYIDGLKIAFENVKVVQHVYSSAPWQAPTSKRASGRTCKTVSS